MIGSPPFSLSFWKLLAFARLGRPKLGQPWIVEPRVNVDAITSRRGVVKDSAYFWIEQVIQPDRKTGVLWKFKTSEVDKWMCERAARDS